MAGGDTSTGAEHKARVAAAIRSLGAVPYAVKSFTAYVGKRRESLRFEYRDQVHLVIPVWQGVQGTTDEKLPFVFESAVINATYDEIHLVLGGDGFSMGAYDWLDAAVNDWNEQGKHPHLCLYRSSDDFRSHCQRWRHEVA